jgi:hypothetical protein
LPNLPIIHQNHLQNQAFCRYLENISAAIVAKIRIWAINEIAGTIKGEVLSRIMADFEEKLTPKDRFFHHEGHEDHEIL